MIKYFVCLFLVSWVPSAVLAQDMSNLSEQVNQTIGRVIVESETNSVTGSGFVVDKSTSGDLFFVTNAHVVEGNRLRILVGFLLDSASPSSMPVFYDGVLLAKSEYQDLALLRLSPTEAATSKVPVPIPLADGVIQQGATVAAFGYPGIADDIGGTLEWDWFRSSITSGVVSRTMETPNWSRSGVRTPVSVIQHEAALNSGNSGGPLINLCAVVVGVNTSVMTAQQGREIYQASSSSEVVKFLKANDVNYLTAPADCVGQGGIATQMPVTIIIMACFVVAVLVLAILQRRKVARIFTKAILDVIILDKNGRSISSGLSRRELQSGVIVGRSSRCTLTVRDPKVSARVRTHSQNITVAASAQADKNRSAHRS